MLDPRLLRAFVTLADTGNFTLAAQRLHLTQSTVSQQINHLEDNIGWELFDRTQRPIRLTAAGEKLIGYARRLLSLQREAQAQLADTSGSAIIRVGLPDDITTAAIFDIFSQFARQNQAIRLDVTTGLSQELSQRYRNGEFDIVVIKEPSPAMDCCVSFPEPLAWFESEAHQGNWPDPMPLITFPPGGLYWDSMFDTMNQSGLNWYVAFSSTSLNSVLSAVEAGLGISLLPLGTTRDRCVRKLNRFPPEPPLAISLYSPKDSPELASLCDEMGRVLKERYALLHAES